MLGFLPAYMTEEKLTSGSGFWLLDVVNRAVPVPVIAYLAVVAAIMAGFAIGALRRSQDPRGEHALGDGTWHCGNAVCFTPLCLVFRLARGAAVRRPVVAGFLADAYRGPALLAAGNGTYSALGGVRDLRWVSHIGLRRYRLEICQCCEVRGTAWPPATQAKSDPRRYFEAVGRRARADRRAGAGLPLSRDDQPLQSVVHDLPAHL